MARRTKAEIETERRVNEAFRIVTDRVVIPMFDIGTIMDAGKAAVARGATDTELRGAMALATEAVRVDR